MSTEKKKICTGCKKEKTLSEFHRANETSDGRHTQCKVCQKEKSDLQKQRQAEYAKKYFTF